MFSLFSKASVRIGVEIAATEVRFLQLKHPCHLKQFAILPFSNGMADASDCLHQIVEQTQTQGCRVALALPAALAVSRKIPVSPLWRAHELEEEVQQQLGHFLPGVTREQLYFDYVLQPTSPEKEPEALIVAALRKEVDSYLETVNRAGLRVKIIEVDTFALQRGEARGKTFMIPDVSREAWEAVKSRMAVSVGLALRRMPRW